MLKNGLIVLMVVFEVLLGSCKKVEKKESPTPSPSASPVSKLPNPEDELTGFASPSKEFYTEPL